MRKIAIGVAAVLLAWGFSVWAYPSLPERVATHWGMAGRADGWSSKAILVFVFPAVMLGLGLLLTVLPKIDPRQKEVVAHAPTYLLLVNVIMVFMAGIQVLLVGVNLGWPIDIPLLIPVGVGLLLMVIGNLMPRMRPNWFMGIRTPWTLASEVVWRKTHRLGGYCFMAMGVLMVGIGFVATPQRFPYLLGAVVALAVIPVVYSYFAWRREQEAAPSSTFPAGE
ncbi:MAG: SdpI family protein [Gemmatimonadales bacterium]